LSREQTEIKIQRPLGLLAQHGMTTKGLQGRASSLYKLDRAEMDAGKDQSPLNMAHHHHHHHQQQQQQQQSLAGLDFSAAGAGAPLSLMHDRRFMPSPPPGHGPSTPLGCLQDKPAATSPSAHHWTFEEQFKQVSRTVTRHDSRYLAVTSL